MTTDRLYRELAGHWPASITERMLTYATRRWMAATTAEAKDRWFGIMGALLRQGRLAESRVTLH